MSLLKRFGSKALLKISLKTILDSLPKTFCDQHKYLEDLSIHKNENNNSRKRDPPSISNLLQGKRESSCDDGK